MNLFILFLQVKWFQFCEERKVRKYFPEFREIDKAFHRAFRWLNPYTVCRRFLQKRGEVDIHAYGETPLTTYDLIAQEVGLSSQDTFVELGCGRGRGVFFLANQYCCRAKGIDMIADFIRRAQQIPVQNVAFEQENFFESDLSEATVVYLYGTNLSDEQIQELSKPLRTLKKGARIVTVSFDLVDYPCIKQLSAKFPWGEADVFIHTNS